jgi:hypothetical protein
LSTPTGTPIIAHTTLIKNNHANYKSIKHAHVEPRRPSVEGSRADQNYRSVPSPIRPGLSTPTNKKKKKSATSNKTKKNQIKTSTKKYNNNIEDASHRDGNMPPFLVKEVDALDTTEFEVALEFWMNY